MAYSRLIVFNTSLLIDLIERLSESKNDTCQKHQHFMHTGNPDSKLIRKADSREYCQLLTSIKGQTPDVDDLDRHILNFLNIL